MGESIDNLRKFHNWIKLQLITDAKHSTNGKSLLDVAVGRGGDIFKWTKNNIGYVTGIDNDAKSIYEKNEFDGAIQRYNLMKTQMKVPRCYFWNISATDPDVLNKLNQKDRGAVYDIVCQPIEPLWNVPSGSDGTAFHCASTEHPFLASL